MARLDADGSWPLLPASYRQFYSRHQLQAAFKDVPVSTDGGSSANLRIDQQADDDTHRRAEAIASVLPSTIGPGTGGRIVARGSAPFIAALSVTLGSSGLSDTPEAGPAEILLAELRLDPTLETCAGWIEALKERGTLILALNLPLAQGGSAIDALRSAGFRLVVLIEVPSGSDTRIGSGTPVILARRATGLVGTPPERPKHITRGRTRSRQTRSPASVIIPLYNHEHYIAAALESVFTQTTPPEEVIVIDDGSSDRSADVAERLCAGYNGAVFWRQPNRGAHNTINAGLRRATQPVLAILNSDDLYHPLRLERSVECLRAERGGMVTSGISFIDENQAPIENPWYHEALRFWREIGNTSLALVHANFIMTTSNLVMERRVLEEVGLFNDLRFAHDLEFLIRALRAGFRQCRLDADLLSYRYHPTNTIKENHTNVRVEWAYVITGLMRRCEPEVREGMTRADYAEALADIALRHNLQKGVMLILQAMLADPTATPSLAGLVSDPAVIHTLRRSLA